MADDIQQLSATVLREFAALCRRTHPDLPLAGQALPQLVGASRSAAVSSWLSELKREGWAGAQAARLLDALADARSKAQEFETLCELVLSGPEAVGVSTRDTGVVTQTLLLDCHQEAILVGYAIYSGKVLFERLAGKMAADPSMRVWFCLDVTPGGSARGQPGQIVQRFAQEFVRWHWPWSPRPDVFYDPRALEEGPGRASLHAKCVIVDRRIALITSANFTEAAQKRNVEAGVLIRHKPTVERLAAYFEGLREGGLLWKCDVTVPTAPT